MPRLSIIVPTYCEAENLPILIPQISEVLASADIDAEIIVADDNSPDGTKEVIAELVELYPVRLLTRTENRGLSPAVIDGMKIAQGEVLLVMDADLSHPPEKIPELYEAIQNTNADFVIGSRYVAGGTTAEDWGLFRWVNSKVATLMARPFTSAKDPMAGFFALRRSDFKNALEKLNPVGYKIGLELIVKCDCKNVAEVPIDFADRLKGESKLTLKEQINYLKHIKLLFDFRYQNWAYLVQFLIVGASGMVIDLASFALLLKGLGLSAARGLAIWIAMTWNFFLNRNVTFSYARQESAFKQYWGFCASCSLGAAVNWGASLILCQSVAYFNQHEILAGMVGVIAGTAFNFVLCRMLVFRKQQPEDQKVESPEISDASVAKETRTPVQTG